MLYGSAAAKLNRSGTFHPTLQTAPKHTKDAHQSWEQVSELHSSRIVGCALTMCTVWLYSSFSAVSPLKRSISFCLSSKNVCSRRLREWHCVTQVLYNSFSLRITALGKHSTQPFTSQESTSLFHFTHIYQSVCSPCLTVLDGRSWPLLMFSLAVCSAADRNSSAFMYNTNCSA